MSSNFVMADTELTLIDANSPFFTNLPDQVANWSKIPFHHLEDEGGLKIGLQHTITQQFQQYVSQVAELGYNAITLDDMVHLVNHDWYPDHVQRVIYQYQTWYQQLIDIAYQYDLAVYITADIGSTLRSRRCSDKQLRRDFETDVKKLFSELPRVKGVIIRFGEHDSESALGDFSSRLAVKKPSQLQRIISSLVPFLESERKNLIVRTWSVGAFAIGDLIWNTKRCEQVFSGIDSSRVIVSAKPGTSDFFRHLEPNPVLTHTRLPVVLELQAKPEYEGAGWLPTVWAGEYQRSIEHFRARANLIGISVWAQTGGWTRAKHLTFGQNSSLWNELNVSLAVGIWHQKSVGSIYQQFAQNKQLQINDVQLSDLANQIELIMTKGWYIKQFSEHTLYFRRTRIPPLLWIYWDEVNIDGPLGVVLRSVVGKNWQQACADGYSAVMSARQLSTWVSANWPQQAEVFKRWVETLELLFVARIHVLAPTNIDQHQLKQKVASYHQRYEAGFRFHLGESLPWMVATSINWLSRFWIRRRMRYRKRDRIQLMPGMVHLLRWLVVYHARRYHNASDLNERAMNLAVLFR